jgi:Flp pilus assembly pilin Flp
MDQRGQGMTEYVIILVAIAVVCIAISVQFGGKIKGLFETADAEIDTVDSGM